jgi:ubiquitin C-terminal hydrolase
MANIFHTPPIVVEASKDNASLSYLNNYIYFITYNSITHILFSNGGLCSLLQDQQYIRFRR